MHEDWNIVLEDQGTYRTQCECGWRRWALVEAVATDLVGAHLQEFARSEMCGYLATCQDRCTFPVGHAGMHQCLHIGPRTPESSIPA